MKNCWWNSPHFRCVNPPCPNWLLVNPLVISPLMISYVYYIYYHIVFPLYTVYIHIYIYTHDTHFMYIFYIYHTLFYFFPVVCGQNTIVKNRPRGWTRPNFRRAHGGWPPMQRWWNIVLGTNYITHRIHGAAIYGNMDPINIPPLC